MVLLIFGLLCITIVIFALVAFVRSEGYTFYPTFSIKEYNYKTKYNINDNVISNLCYYVICYNKSKDETLYLNFNHATTFDSKFDSISSTQEIEVLYCIDKYNSTYFWNKADAENVLKDMHENPDKYITYKYN